MDKSKVARFYWSTLYKERDRQMDRQTDRHTHRHTKVCWSKGNVRWLLKSGDFIRRQNHPTNISCIMQKTFCQLTHSMFCLWQFRRPNLVYVAMMTVYTGRQIFILVIYFVSYLFSFIRPKCKKSDASKPIILWSAICCCAGWYCMK